MRASVRGAMVCVPWCGLVLVACCVLVGGQDARAKPEEPPAAITVNVHDPDGKPYEGAQVWVGPIAATCTPTPEATTNAEGVARLAGVEPGTTADLTVLPRDADWDKYVDLVRKRILLQDMTVRLEPALTIRGKTVGPSGEPVPHARIYLNPAVAGGYAPGVTLSRADGSFVIHRLQAGNVRLAAGIAHLFPKDMKKAIQVVAGAQDVVLPVEQQAGQRKPLYYFWVYTANGRPVQAAEGVVRIGGRDQGWGGEVSGAFEDGFLLDQNVHTTCWVESYAPRSRLGAPLPYGPAASGPHGPGGVDVEIRLPPEKVIAGHVLDPDGQAVGGVKIEALPFRAGLLDAGVEGTAIHATCVSGSDGGFRLGQLGQGEYRLKVTPPPEFARLDVVPVLGGSTDVELPLSAGASPKVTVLGWQGKPVAGATVRVGFATGFDLEMQDDSHFEDWRGFPTNETGMAHLHGLSPEARYALVVQPPKDRLDVFSRRVQDWAPEDTEIKLPRAYKIEGTVKDPAGNPVPGAKITYRMVPGGRQGPWVMGRLVAAADGTFRADRLWTGSYTFTADPADAPPRAQQQSPGDGEGRAQRVIRTRRPPQHTDFEAGTADAVLVANMPTALSVRILDWTKAYQGVVAVLAPEKIAGDAEGTRKTFGRDEIVTFEGIDWTTEYVLWVGSGKSGHCFYEMGIRVRDGDLAVRLEAGKTLRGKLVPIDGLRSRRVWVQYPGFKVFGKLKAAGRFEIPGLPTARTYDVRATARKGKTQLYGEEIAQEGEEPTITLAPE